MNQYQWLLNFGYFVSLKKNLECWQWKNWFVKNGRGVSTIFAKFASLSSKFCSSRLSSNDFWCSLKIWSIWRLRFERFQFGIMDSFNLEHWKHWSSAVTLNNLVEIVEIADYTCARKLYISLRVFSDPFTTCICAYILMLPRLCSCALDQLQKFVLVAYCYSCCTCYTCVYVYKN